MNIGNVSLWTCLSVWLLLCSYEWRKTSVLSSNLLCYRISSYVSKAWRRISASPIPTERQPLDQDFSTALSLSHMFSLVFRKTLKLTRPNRTANPSLGPTTTNTNAVSSPTSTPKSSPTQSAWSFNSYFAAKPFHFQKLTGNNSSRCSPTSTISSRSERPMRKISRLGRLLN